MFGEEDYVIGACHFLSLVYIPALALLGGQATDILTQVHEWALREVKDRCVDNRSLQMGIAGVLHTGTADERLGRWKG